MAELASYVAIQPRTIQNTNAALVRGMRVTLASTSLVALTPDATTRGDFVTLVDMDASTAGSAAAIANGEKVPALFDGAIAVGALAYASATAGMFSPTSTNAALMGRCSLAASGTGILGEVELFSVA